MSIPFFMFEFQALDLHLYHFGHNNERKQINADKT